MGKSKTHRTPKDPLDVERKRPTYAIAKRVAEVGMMHGYYMAYLAHGLKEGEPIDVAALTTWSMEQVRKEIEQLQGIGFIQQPDGTSVRLDVLKDVVEIGYREQIVLARSLSSKNLRKGKKKAHLLKKKS
jgi:hypothetical protein